MDNDISLIENSETGDSDERREAMRLLGLLEEDTEEGKKEAK